MSKYIIGFTGTQTGMTLSQKAFVKAYFNSVINRLLTQYPSYQILAVHGDCVGADKDFDDIARQLNVPRHIFPCNIEAKRAHCERLGAIQVHAPIAPLDRNHLIVDYSTAMLATPKTNREELRSGTWATVRYAKKQNKLLLVINP